MDKEVYMTQKEAGWAAIFLQIHQRKMTQQQAAQELGRSLRQVQRLYGDYKVRGNKALVSKKRGNPSDAGNIAENMSSIRRIALNLLKQEKSAKCGMEIKRQMAGWDNEYLLKVIGVKSFS